MCVWAGISERRSEMGSRNERKRRDIVQKMKGIDLRSIVLRPKPRQERGGDDWYRWEDIWRREGETKRTEDSR